MELLAATSRAGERGGSVMEAGTEKTKWWSILHSGGGHTHMHTHCYVKVRLTKGQKSQEVIDNETQGILYPFHILSHCQLESRYPAAVALEFPYPKQLNCTKLCGVKMPVGTQAAAHHPGGSSRQGAAC